MEENWLEASGAHRGVPEASTGGPRRERKTEGSSHSADNFLTVIAIMPLLFGASMSVRQD